MKIAQLLMIWAVGLGYAEMPWHDATQELPLQSLTVPANALTPDCRLQPEHIGGRVRQPFASNPWIGDDRAAVVMIKTAMGLALMTRMPDGPPLDRRQAAEFERRAMEGVNQGYRAAYEDSDGVDVEVLALDFDTAAQAAALQLISRGAANQTTRLMRGPTLIVIKAHDAHSGCLEPVRAHIASLK